jgi:L-fuconolactonase
MKRRQFIGQSLKTSIGWMAMTHGFETESNGGAKKRLKTDTHMHLFDLEHFKYPWLERVPKINRSFSLDDFRAASKRSGVGKIVFMESGASPEFALPEALRVASLAKEEPRIKGLVAQLSLESDIEQSPDFRSLLEISILKGIRSKFQGDSKLFVDNLRLLGAHDLTFDLLLSGAQLQSAAEITKQCSETIFILDHIGNPDFKQDTFNEWKKGIRLLAAQPNVCCKISGMISRIGSNWNLDLLRPYVMHVCEQFGTGRLVYGGDWPVVLLGDSYQAWSDAFDRLMTGFSKDELSMIYHENADRIYNL